MEQPRRKTFEKKPPRASLFVTCLVDQFRPQVAESVVSVLARLGVTVDVPRDQTCCGQPAFNSGYLNEAREVASRFLDQFDGDDPIVCPSGSCAAMVRNYYPVLFRDDPVETERARLVADRLYEFSEFVVDGMGEKDLAGSSDESITYQKCCHSLRELGIDEQPQALLRAVVGLDIKPMERDEVCCGFGGAFSVKMPDISTAMLDEKLDNVERAGAKTLVAGDLGCIMHMEGGLRKRGTSIGVVHTAELLDRAARRRERSEAT